MPPSPSSVCEKLSLKHGLLARDVVSVNGFLYSAIKRTNYTLVACDSEWVTVASYNAFSVSTKVVHLQCCLVVMWLVPQAHNLEPETFWSWVWRSNPQLSPLPTPQHHCHLSVIVRLRYAASIVCLWIPSLLMELVVCVRNAITYVCLSVICLPKICCLHCLSVNSVTVNGTGCLHQKCHHWRLPVKTCYC